MTSSTPTKPDLVCVAAVAAAHGVRGALKLKCFTETPENVGAYGPLLDSRGRELFTVEVVGPAKGGVIVQAHGITDREAAEALKGERLYVPRERLPEPEDDSYYYTDLIGLEVRDSEGARLGQVTAVHDFGAGEVIEFADAAGRTAMVAFTTAMVPEVDLAGRRLVIAADALEALA